MFETLFGSEMPLAARFFIAFLVVLALIGLTAWFIRRFGANRLGGAARGRQPRLAVIDAATVDGRRRLVLIRSDANGWPLQPSSEPPPIVPARSYRATAIEEPWHPPEPGARARPAENLAGPSAEVTPRVAPPEPASRTASPVVPPPITRRTFHRPPATNLRKMRR